MGREQAKREAFTAARVAGYRCPEGKKQAFFWDAEAPGFGLRVTAGGARSYIFEGFVNGKTLRLTIGSPDVWPLETEWLRDPATKERIEHRRGARAEARRLKALTDQGIDPRDLEAARRAQVEAERQAEAAAVVEQDRQAVTFGAAWEVYVTHVATEKRKGKMRSARYVQDHRRLAARGGEPRKRGAGLTVAGPLASLLDKPLREITAETIAGWLSKESEKRPTNAAHAFRLLRAFVRWAAEKPEYAGLVAPDVHRASSVQNVLPKEHAKERDCLEREQLAAWFAEVRKLSNPVVSAYLQGLLLTGARREELAELRWEDVDLKWRSMTIRDKVDGTRTIPLPAHLAELLADLKRRNETPRVVKLRPNSPPPPLRQPSPWVFSSPRAASGRIEEPRKAHNRVLADAGLPHVTLHGLRRSFGTLAEWVEAPAGVVAQIQGHKPSALAEKHYRRRPLDLLRKWHDKIEDWMLVEGKVREAAPAADADAKAGEGGSAPAARSAA